MEDTRLGALLLETRLVSERDLQHCLDVQELTGGARPLGRILVEQGVISEVALNRLLELQEARRSEPAMELNVEGGDVDRCLRAAIDLGANEVVLSEGRAPTARVAGRMVRLSDQPVDGPQVWDFVRSRMGLSVLERLADVHSLTAPLDPGCGARGRITAFRHFDGIAVIVRLHPAGVRMPEWMDDRLLTSLREGSGLLLVCGEQGGGLTETFATMIAEAARPEGRSILVLDDSIEYPLPDDAAAVLARRVGEDTCDWSSAMRVAFAEQHDIVFANGCDDGGFEAAMHVAETGRLVVVGMRAPSSVVALRTILAAAAPFEEARVRRSLASVLTGVLAVQVVPGADARGSTLATELLWCDASARELIRAGSVDQLRALLRSEDGRNGHAMDQDLLRLLQQRRIRFEDAFFHAGDKAMVLHRGEARTEATR